MELFNGSPRERRLLIGLGLAVIAALLFWLIAGRSPEVATVDDDIDRALRDLQTVQTMTTRIPVAPTGPREPFDRSQLIRGAQAAGLSISRVEPREAGAMSVSFEASNASAVLRFLQDMERSTTARIVELDMESAPDNSVDAQILLSPQP